MQRILRAMQSLNKPVQQLFREVRSAVHEETKNQQTPWKSTHLEKHQSER
jgi:hypothetical protein